MDWSTGKLFLLFSLPLTRLVWVERVFKNNAVPPIRSAMPKKAPTMPNFMAACMVLHLPKTEH
jgi:hypothetical protein